MKTHVAWAASLTILCLGTAGCQQRDGASTNLAAPTAGNGTEPAANSNMADENETATDALEGAPGSEPKSILRPDVAPAEPTPPPLEPVSATIGFGTSGTRLDDPGRQAIDDLLGKPAVAAGGPVILRGNTDARGSDQANLIVSRRMAEAVRDYLVKKGIEPSRISVIALGERRPIAPNAHEDGSDDAEGRARNRRVEIAVELPAAADPATAKTPAP